MRNKFLILIFLFCFLVFSQFSFSYSTYNTHPVLTEEITKFNNLKNQNYKFSQQEIEWLRQGSIREDEPARWINHFYDPINNKGWSGKHFGTLTPEQGLDSGESLAPRPVLASIDWAVNQEYQSAYSMQYGNQTWQKALNSYIKDDKKSAFLALGHILHLIEDLSVPDHTRDDTHAGLYGDPGSPYEEYAKNYTNYNKLTVAEELINQNKEFINFSTLQEYFRSLALYSNQNFFSEDTISNEEYEKPRINELIIIEKNINGEILKFLYDSSQNTYLAKINKDIKNGGINFSTDNELFALLSFRSHLFPQAVLTGASVTNQFFKEVEYYKQNPNLLEPVLPDQNQSILQTIKTAPKLVFIKGVDIIDGIATNAKVFLSNTTNQIKTLISKPKPSPAGVLSIKESPELIPELITEEKISEVPSPIVANNKTREETRVIKNSIIGNTTSIISNVPTYVYTLPPAKKPASSIIDRYGLIGIPSAAGAGGGGEVVQQPQQTQSQAQSSVSQSPPPDTTPPTIGSFSILECQNSLSSQNCLIATTTVNLSWNSNDSDLDYYEFSYGANTSTTTTTSKLLTLQNNAAYSFSLRAKDKSNNWSATFTASVEINTLPVIINEIAWMGIEGTNGQYGEWIELYNLSNQEINLAGWKLYRKGGLLESDRIFTLTKSIQPNNYLVIERITPSISDPLPNINDEIGAFGGGNLVNLPSGEFLVLKDNSGNIIQSLDFSSGWPAGDNQTKETMQKNGNSWCAAIATPKAENNCQNRTSQNPSPDTTPPNPPIITFPASFNQTFTTTTINFQGTAEANSAITANYSLNSSATTTATTTSNLGTWSLSLNLNQGTTTINFYAKDLAQNQSQATSVQLFIDSIGSTNTTPPNAPIIVSPSNFNQTFASSTINFQGAAEASSTVQAVYSFNNSTTTATTTASSAGNWSLTLSLNQATTTINFYAVDLANNTSSSTPATLFVDSLGPEISSFVISQCASSLSSGGCLVATTTLNFTWSSSSQDINYYELNYGSNTSTTTATSTSLTLSDNSSYNFSLRAVDLSGNWSATSTVSAEINTMPIAINEIGWMGTSASYSSDEFIELYNRTSKIINLNNFVLYSSDLAPYINLTGSIASSSYYLLERTDNNTISDIAANQTYAGALDNTGETLSLVYVVNNSTTTIDYIPLCGGGWCAGTLYSSMERIDTDAPGSSSSNWATNNGIIRNGRNAAGTAINATPKQRNSANSLISTNQTINQDITITKNRSPYFVENSLTVAQGKTLTINPGVVIKFKEGSGVSLNINGNLYVHGSQSEPVVFTSFRDDDCGLQNGCSDLNGDANSTSPIVGNNWKEVYLSPTSSSTINYAIFRYSGGYSFGDSSGRALLRADQATSTIANSIFEYSYVNGIKLTASNSLISNNIFRYNNNSSQDSSGINADGGSPTIANNTFESNKRGLLITNSGASVQNNIFNNNLQEAVSVSSILPSFSNNSGSGNGVNAIVLNIVQTQVNSTTTLATNSLAFILDGYSTVVSSSTLVIASPNQIKAKNTGWLKVNGRLITQGTNSNDIVFTSTNDPASPQKGDWYGLWIENGYLEMNGTTIKYAGENVFGGASGGLVLENSTAIIKNSAFGYNKNSAIYMTSSNLNLDTVSFNNNDTALSAPDWPTGSTVSSSNITFQNNTSISSPAGIF